MTTAKQYYKPFLLLEHRHCHPLYNLCDDNPASTMGTSRFFPTTAICSIVYVITMVTILTDHFIPRVFIKLQIRLPLDYFILFICKYTRRSQNTICTEATFIKKLLVSHTREKVNVAPGQLPTLVPLAANELHNRIQQQPLTAQVKQNVSVCNTLSG